MFGVRRIVGLCFMAASEASETLTDGSGGGCRIHPAHSCIYVLIWFLFGSIKCNILYVKYSEKKNVSLTCKLAPQQHEKSIFYCLL